MLMKRWNTTEPARACTPPDGYGQWNTDPPDMYASWGDYFAYISDQASELYSQRDIEFFEPLKQCCHE